MNRFKNITPFNGFYEDTNLGQQNNYAWAMAELDDYIYVGVGKNIVYSVLRFVLNLPIQYIPEVFIPKPSINPGAEIWRYRKDGSENWTQVYKSNPQDGIGDFRYMISYRTASGKKVLLAAANSFSSSVKMLISENGTTWEDASQGITAGDTARAMVEHNGKMYLGVMKGLGGTLETILYETNEPKNGWTRIEMGTGANNPRGEIASMESFNDHLYIGTAPPGGFEVWRTRGISPQKDQWQLVVDKGAGEALNQLPLSMKSFKGNLYVGTGIWFGVFSIDPSKRFVPPKGFDLIRISPRDNWSVIIGNEAISPTDPTTRGIRRPEIPAGLWDVSNAYCWQLDVYNNRLYLGTWDWSVLLPTFIKTLIENFPGISSKLSGVNIDNIKSLDFNNLNIKDLNIAYLDPSYNYEPLIESILQSLMCMRGTLGGDLWVSYNGYDWRYITLDGLGDPHNYGIRNLLPSENGKLYIGTANPYEGCEVWASRWHC